MNTLSKVVASTAITTLTIVPFSNLNAEGVSGNVLTNPSAYASAASLTEFQLLTDVAVNAQLGDADENGLYDLGLSLTGRGLADAELFGPERTVIFYSPDLADKWTVEGPAQVRVEILPVTMDALPTVGNLIGDITQQLNTTVNDLVAAVDRIVNNPITAPLIRVSGLTELQDALSALNNIDGALADLLAYNDEVEAVVQPDGSILVNFSDGLGNHLESAVQDVVVQLLNDVVDAIGNVSIDILGGGISVPLEPLQALVQPLLGLIDNISSGAVDLSNDLAGVQLLGRTEVTLNTKVDGTDASGEVPIYGAGVHVVQLTFNC